jgi:hypothetical protein
VDRLALVAIEDRHPRLVGPLQPAGGVGVAERPLGEDPVQLQERFGSEGWPHLLAHELERPVVVEDHPLAAVVWLPAAAQQLLGDDPRRRRPLQLARADRLLHQGVDEEPPTRPPLGGHHLVHRDLASAALVDVVEMPENDVWQSVAERQPAGVVQGEQALFGEPPRRDRQPPFLGAEALGRIETTQLVPVQVSLVVAPFPDPHEDVRDRVAELLDQVGI